MKATTRAWLEGLRDRAAGEWHGTSSTHREQSAAESAAERMILAARISSWLTGFGEVIDARSGWLASESLDGDRDPAIVVTTSFIGAAVVDEVLETGSVVARSLARAVVPVSERAYRLWCIAHPDPTYLQHVNLWNWIKTKVPEQRHSEFAKHPLRTSEAYWLHRTGIAGAGPADRRDCHLWKWTGQQAVLLEAFVTERSVGRLGGAEGD